MKESAWKGWAARAVTHPGPDFWGLAPTVVQLDRSALAQWGSGLSRAPGSCLIWRPGTTLRAPPAAWAAGSPGRYGGH